MEKVTRLTRVEEGRRKLAGEIRAELARAQIKGAHLPRLIGGSQSYWSRRLTGERPFNSDDLVAIAELLSMEITEIWARVEPLCAARESNPQPADWDTGAVVLQLRRAA